MKKVLLCLSICWLLMMGNARSQVVYEFGDAPDQIEEMFGTCMTVAGFDEYILDTLCMLNYTDTFTVYDKYTNYLSEYSKWTFLKYLKNVHTLQVINKNKSEPEYIDIGNCLNYCPKNIVNLYVSSPIDVFWRETLPAHFQSLVIDLDRYSSGFLDIDYSSKSFFQQNSSLKELYLSFRVAGNTSALLEYKFPLPDSLENLTFLIRDYWEFNPPPEVYIENHCCPVKI